MLISAILVGFFTHSYLNNAKVIKGEVIELVPKASVNKATSYSPKIQYSVDNEILIFTSIFSSSPPMYELGETLPIVYNKSKKKQAIGSFFHLYGFTIIGGLISSCGITIFLAYKYGFSILKMLHPHLILE